MGGEEKTSKASDAIKKQRKLKRRERNHTRRYLLKESTTIVKVPLNFKSDFTDADKEAIQIQLGYFPSNLHSVCAVDALSKKPTACLLYPLAVPSPERRRKNKELAMEPFPTIYWLTCPLLKVRISTLEVQRWVPKLEQRLKDSPIAQEEMKLAHKAYAARRWAMVEPAHKEQLEVKGWTSAVRDVGIAGIRKPMFIKCLHTMYAFYLALHAEAEDALAKGQVRENVPFPVGDWIHELLTSPPGDAGDSEKEPFARAPRVKG